VGKKILAIIMKKQIINLENLEFHDWSHGDSFAGRMGEIGLAVGAEKLGYNLTVVPAGKRAFPMHCHYANEEMFFILEGHGEIRMGDACLPIRKGDVINCPAGGPETAHQIINTMEEGELKYLAVSTTLSPEICQYADTGKTLVSHYPPPGGRGSEILRFILREGEGNADYWEGET
jgi:uncharacterized cupin superfamily protein